MGSKLPLSLLKILSSHAGMESNITIGDAAHEVHPISARR